MIDDVRKCVTMDLKEPDASVFLLGPKDGAQEGRDAFKQKRRPEFERFPKRP